MLARHGAAGSGWARRGAARHGAARHGTVWPPMAEKETGRMNDIKPEHEVKAAIARITDWLDEKLKIPGASFTLDDLSAVSGFSDAQRLVGAVRKYYRDHGHGHTIRQRGEILTILTADGEASAGIADMGVSSRAIKRGLKKFVSAMKQGVTDPRQKQIDHWMRYAVTRIDDYEKARKVSKAIVGAPIPQPRLPGKSDQ